MKVPDLLLGQSRVFESVEYFAIERKACFGCAFEERESCREIELSLGHCSNTTRKDKRSIQFVTYPVFVAMRLKGEL